MTKDDCFYVKCLKTVKFPDGTFHFKDSVYMIYCDEIENYQELAVFGYYEQATLQDYIKGMVK